MNEKSNEVKRLLKIFLLGCLAGSAIGLGGYAYLVSLTYLGDGIGKVVGSLLFSFGLFSVTFLGFKLYTGRIGFVLDKEKGEFSNIVFMLLGNVTGALILALILNFINLNNAIIDTATNCLINKTLNLTDYTSYFRLLFSGIMCGVLVFLSVFLFKGFKNPIMKFIGVCFPVIMFVFLGFDHSIANIFYYGFTNTYSTEAFLSIIFVLLGNSIGSIIIYFFFKVLKIGTGE